MQISNNRVHSDQTNHFNPISAKDLESQKNYRQIFKKVKLEERKLDVSRCGRQGDFFPSKMQFPVPLTALWGEFNSRNGKDDNFSCEYSYNYGEATITIEGTSKKIMVKIGKDEWSFDGNQPSVETSMSNKFCLIFRGPKRQEVVEFEISKENTGPRGKILNSSLTSDIRHIKYLPYDLENKETRSPIERNRALIYRQGVDGPYKVFKRVGDQEETLYYDQAIEEKLPQDRYCPVKTKIITANGLDHTVHCVLPKGLKEGEKVPAIFYVHGGPMQCYDADFTSFDHKWAQYYASRGFAFIGINYRGNTGFGADYRNAILGDFAGEHLQDVKGLAGIVKQFDFVDPNQFHYFGHSFGAYAGGMFTTKDPQFLNETFKTVTLVSGVYDWSKNLKGTCDKEPTEGCSEKSCSWHGPLDESARNARRVQWHTFFGKEIGKDNEGAPIYSDPHDDKELQRKISPIAHDVTKLTPPIHLIHGTSDTIASHKFTEDFAKKLSDAGNNVATTFIQGANHEFKGKKPFKQMLGSMKKFVQQH